MPWGGHRLSQWQRKPLPNDCSVGEAWLLADHHLHCSRVEAGRLSGLSLRQLMEQRALDLMGKTCARFPLLVKMLDARENLSVQVHPNDSLAMRWAPKEGGKTEAWLVLDADPGSTIYLGLKDGVDSASFAKELSFGSPIACLRSYEPKPGDCYFVPAGTVHALGGGVVVLEVQQTSDATFRLYDWDRLDQQGKPRQLHLDAGLACLIDQSSHAGLQSPRNLPGAGGGVSLISCPFFGINRYTPRATIRVAGPSIWIGLDGQARIVGQGTSHSVSRGDLVLIPAEVHDCRLEPAGNCDGVLITLPQN